MVTCHGLQPPVIDDNQRHHRLHHPTVWGDFFLGFRPCTPAQCQSMKSKAQVMKEELRTRIADSGSADVTLKLELVDALQRLGLDYHYKKEIDDFLCGINDDGDEPYDLHTTTLQFYLLRKQGYNVSPDVFLKFRDVRGNITCNDTRSLLDMYNAAHVRTHGEGTLDRDIAYTKDRLERILEQSLSPSVSLDEVRHALEMPLFRRPRRVERERDQYSGQQQGMSTVEACMEENNYTAKEDAYSKLRELIEESWMDISEEHFRPAGAQPPAQLLEVVVDATRMLDFLYKDQDAYTIPQALKRVADSIYVDPI
uniref:Uncharacterized protein n=1 Tax=Avena sativa TaxID=4498 RepID=A0ACD6AAX4_AVESA